MIHYWLMKSEPTSFSIEDLEKRPQQIEPWDGVRNYQARNFLQAMRINDLAFFYHSSCPNPGIVGIIKIVKSAYPDKTAFDPSHHHYDPKSKPEKQPGDHSHPSGNKFLRIDNNCRESRSQHQADDHA